MNLPANDPIEVMAVALRRIQGEESQNGNLPPVHSCDPDVRERGDCYCVENIAAAALEEAARQEAASNEDWKLPAETEFKTVAAFPLILMAALAGSLLTFVLCAAVWA